MNKLQNKTIFGVKLITSIEFLRYASEIFILIFTARILSPIDFGIVATALVVIALSDSFTQFGFSTPIIQFKEDSLNLINTAWTADLIRAVLLTTLLIVFSDQISSLMKNDEIKYPLILLSCRPIFQSLINPYLNYLIRDLELKQYSKIFLSSIIIRLIIVIPLTIYFQNYWALIIGSLSATAIKTIMSYFFIDYKPKLEIQFIKFKKLFSFSIWILISRFYQIIFKNFPYLILANNVNISNIGGYRVSEQIGTIFDNIYKKFSSKVILPSLSEVNRSQIDKSIIYENNFILLISSALYLTLPSYYFAEIIIYTILGEKWLFIDILLKNFIILGGLLLFLSYLVSLSISIGFPKIDAISKIVLSPFLIYFVYSSTNEIEIIKILISIILFNIFFLLIFTKRYLNVNFLKILYGVLFYTYPLFISFIVILSINNINYFSSIIFIATIILITIFNKLFNQKNLILDIFTLIKS